MKSGRLVPATAFLAAGLLAATFGTGPLQAGHGMEATATYEVTFIPAWNPQTHPLNYPLTHAKQGLLTPFIGATHGSGYAVFHEGTRPTPGLEMLSEMGKQDVLASEIEGAISSGRAGTLIRTDMGSPGPVHAPVSLKFDVRSDMPRVSLVGMIAPSPDWFYGVEGVELTKRGDWISQVAVPAYAWDSGGDAGMSYMAEDQDLEPKEPTRLSDAASFQHDGSRVPVGTFVFKRVPGARS